MISGWIDIMCGFLQGDSYSPVGFCISEIPVCKLLQQSKGYRIGTPGNWSISKNPQSVHRLLEAVSRKP